jgi:hypothetical protein
MVPDRLSPLAMSLRRIRQASRNSWQQKKIELTQEYQIIVDAASELLPSLPSSPERQELNPNGKA